MTTKTPSKPDRTKEHAAEKADLEPAEQGSHSSRTADQHRQTNNQQTQSRQGREDTSGANTQGQTKAQPLNVGESASIRDIHNAVTTKYNEVFMLTNQIGDVLPEEHGYGLYFRDTQYLDEWVLRIAGDVPIPLLSDASHGYESRMELTNPLFKLPDGSLFKREHLSIRRTQALKHHITDSIELRNLSQQSVQFDLTLTFGSHFTNMFVIRGSDPGKRGTLHPPQAKGNTVVLAYDGADQHRRTVTIRFNDAPDALDGSTATYHVKLKPRASCTINAQIELKESGPGTPVDSAGTYRPEAQDKQHHTFDQALQAMPTIETNNALFNLAMTRSLDDVRMLATSNHDDIYVSAGVPWYAALFGRDSCTCAYQTLAYQPELARTTLRVLARYQGTEVNDFQDESPGKILHELRLGEKANLAEVPMIPYYGSVDSTPWFLMLMCGYVRWTGDLELFRELEDNVNRALDWIDGNLKSRIQGFLTYGSRSEKGLTNQGWKDSSNSIVNSDGSLAQPPIALVEVQGYVYHAWRELAHLFELIGDAKQASQLRKKAEDLRQRWDETYWMAKKKFYALAIERDRSLAEAVASNPGQCFFTGMIPDDKAKTVADRLLEEDMFCGWGIRTLSANEKAYNPLDYQVGSVWPHDNALIALGLRRYGFTDHMEKVFTGIFDASTQFNHFRLPEVFDGFSDSDYEKPVHYPVACSPQAWAAGALPLMLQAALGLEPDALQRTLHIHRPHLPKWMSSVTVHGLTVGQAKVDLQYQRQGDTTLVAVLGRQGDIEVLVQY